MGRTSDARERLIASAGELIHDKGYNAVGVNEVCTHAGVNKGSFYHFFPSKQQMALAVIDQFWAESRSMFETMLAGEGSPMERLQHYFDGVYEHQLALQESCGRLRGCPLANLALEMSTQDAVLRARLASTFDAQASYLENLVREGVQASELSGVDPAKAARDLLAYIEGSILLSKLRNDPSGLQDLASGALRLLGAESPDLP